MHIIQKYPRLCLLLLSVFAAYFLYAMGGLHWLGATKGSMQYPTAFIGGLLFTFGFTTPFGIGVFLEIGQSINPVIGAMVGGMGALLADLFIFQVMRFEFFHEELHQIRSSRFALWIHGFLHHESFPEKLRTYLLWSFAGIIIASPLPDEFGVALVSSMLTVDRRAFAVLSFVCNSAAILLVILSSHAFA